MDEKRKFLGVQILRGFAALLVISFHVAWNLQDGNGFTRLSVPYFGNGGVDLFFLISGFVIVWTTRGSWQVQGVWRTFLEKRLIRIIPLYWLLTSVKIAIILIVPFMARNSTLTVWNSVASFLLIPSFNGQHDILPVISAGWTLCFEMFFYYAFTLCLVLRVRPDRALTPIFIVLAAVGCFRTPGWGAEARVLDPLLLEFVAGMWIAELASRQWFRYGIGTLELCALLGSGCVGLMLSDLLPPQSAYTYRVIVWGIPSAAIMLSVVGLEGRIAMQRLRIPLILGDASYSIYLVHVVLLSPVIALAKRYQFSLPGELAVFAAIVLLGLLAGTATYYLIERPMMTALRYVMLYGSGLFQNRVAPKSGVVGSEINGSQTRSEVAN